ncbi:MAG TPA: TVP38/TMEM64 family protein [Gemmatimonadaceae bacterium]|nr:TVP38/TMEM64 family protein [Gemmatimonadaceae bacterium]
MKLRSTAAALVGVVLIATLLWRLGAFGLEDPRRLADVIRHLRQVPAAKVAFVILYATLTAVGVPASPFTLAGGALFGVWWGVLLNWISAMLGAAAGYRLARLFRTAVVRWLSEHRRSQLDALGQRHGARTLFRLRVIPVVPFALLNAASALVGMRWPPYLAATAAGIIPVIVVYTTFAASIVAGARGASHRALIVALVSGAALIALSFAPRLFAARGSRDHAATP